VQKGETSVNRAGNDYRTVVLVLVRVPCTGIVLTSPLVHTGTGVVWYGTVRYLYRYPVPVAHISPLCFEMCVTDTGTRNVRTVRR
jgi:hypothetical protein